MDKRGREKEECCHAIGDKYIWGEGKMGHSWGARWVNSVGHGEEHSPAGHQFSGLLWASIFPSVFVKKAGCSGVSPGAGIKKGIFGNFGVTFTGGR